MIEKIKNKIVIYILLILFFAFFIYIIFSYVHRFVEKDNATFQIKRGSIRESISAKGYVYRDEVLINAKKSGYVLYVYEEGEKVARNDVVLLSSNKELSLESEYSYIVDSDKLYDICDDRLNNIDDMRYSDLYNIKEEIENAKKDAIDLKSNDEMYADNQDFKNKSAERLNTKDAGIISYDIDGYEGYKLEDYKEEYLYAKRNIRNMKKNYLESGEPACKVIKNFEYKIIFDTQSKLDDYIGKDVKVYISTIGKYADARVEKFTSNDGLNHYYLSLNKYMEDLSSIRVIDMEIIFRESTGLKISNNCIYNRNCITIDKNYIYHNEETDETYIYKLDGKNKKKLIVDIVYEDKNNIYILYEKNKANLNINDRIVKDDKEYNISNIKSYTGVMCLNKGYKVFRIIDILCQNAEYSIINENSNANLHVYDMILVNVDM